MAITLTTSIVLAIVAAAVGAMAILGLIGILVNRFRKQRREDASQKIQAKRTKSGSPKRKKSSQEPGRKIYTLNDDTYSIGTFDGGLGTFRTEPFPSMSELLPPSDSRSIRGSPFTPTALDHSVIQSDDFDDVWSFMAVSTSHKLLRRNS
jgi:cytoskeletal protein RodZ